MEPGMPPPSELTAHQGYRLRMVSNAVSQDFARKLAAEDITVAEWVLMRSLYGEAPTTPSSLADRMGLTRGAITKLADRLMAKGLVGRKSHETDGRAHYLFLTEEGMTRVPKLADIADENDAAFVDVLDANDLAALDRLLRLLVERHSLRGVPVD
jgi:DNA-binding MarR family transcriptional regulator